MIRKTLGDPSPLKALPVPLADWIHTCLMRGRKPFTEWKAITSPASVWFPQLGINLAFRPVYQVEKNQTKWDENMSHIRGHYTLTPNLTVAQNPHNLHATVTCLFFWKGNAHSPVCFSLFGLLISDETLLSDVGCLLAYFSKQCPFLFSFLLCLCFVKEKTTASRLPVIIKPHHLFIRGRVVYNVVHMEAVWY